MLFRQTFLITTLFSVLTGCAALERQAMNGLEDTLSAPYQSPQIVVDVATEFHAMNSFTHTQLRSMLTTTMDTSVMAATLNLHQKSHNDLASRVKRMVPASVPMTIQYDITSPQGVTLHRAVAMVLGCRNNAQKPELRDSKTRYSAQMECATMENLVATIADPRDLLKGQSLRQTDSVSATSAVQAYLSGNVMGLNESPISVGGN